MHKIRAYNAAAAINLADYAARARCLRGISRERVTATQKAIDLSQALIANIDALAAELTSELTRKGWLWPTYRSAPSEPEKETEPLSAAQWRLDSPQEAVAQWRDSAQEALVRAETMRDPNARRMMRELAMHYETLAFRVESAALQNCGVEHWYGFSAPGSKPLYGFGTLEQAFTFASRLNRTPERIIYSMAALTDAEAHELRLEDNAEALSLTVALAEKE